MTKQHFQFCLIVLKVMLPSEWVMVTKIYT